MPYYRAAPKFEVPMQINKQTSSTWYRWFQDTDTGAPPSSEQPVSLTGSPMTFQATQKGFLIIHGGTVSSVVFNRVGSYPTGQTQGVFPMSQSDMLTITYSGTPTLTFVPQ